MARTADRENLMKMIYQMDMTNDFSTEACITYKENVLSKEPEDSYFTDTFKLVQEHLSEIDETINAASDRWKTARMAKVDLAILRLAAAEVLYVDELSVAVSADEAVRLAKKYSTEKSAKFINGVIGGIAKSHDE